MGRWVTMNGAHVWIEDGQSPMDAFIRQQTQKNNKNSSLKSRGFPDDSEEYNGYVIAPFNKTKDIFGNDIYGSWEIYKPEKYDITNCIASWIHTKEDAKKSIDNMKKYKLL